MFNSQYYTCEQVDERLLQGYVDDFNEVNNTNYSKEELLLKLFQAINWDQVFGKYEESSDFLRLYTDRNGRLLWGIKTNGDIYYGIGIPSQIKDYIDGKIRELHLDKVNDILIFLDDLIESDKTLGELLEEKVDKEEGKSLIDSDFASGIKYIENNEFLHVKLDANNRILEANCADGSKIFGFGIKVNGYIKVRGDIDHTGIIITNDFNREFVRADIDKNGKLLSGIKSDGDGIYGGFNISEIKRDLDVAAIGFRYEPETGNYYVKVNNDTTITIRYDEATGNIYQVKDSKIEANIEIRENGDMYIVQELKVKN